ncbi:hypothetical protein KR009_009584 [Drosophila setifemur]|nr:hypothetical protein KR009_009584 [Drosophila setifemur]
MDGFRVTFGLCALLFFFGLVHGYPRPQFGNENPFSAPNWVWVDQQQPQQQSVRGSDTTTTTIKPQPTNPSPQYLDCLGKCPTTSEYNPVCGSDNINYQNNNKFECAVRCGQSE